MELTGTVLFDILEKVLSSIYSKDYYLIDNDVHELSIEGNILFAESFSNSFCRYRLQQSGR